MVAVGAKRIIGGVVVCTIVAIPAVIAVVAIAAATSLVRAFFATVVDKQTLTQTTTPTQ